MIKCYCDKCGKEIKEYYCVPEKEEATNGLGVTLWIFTKSVKCLCEECHKKYEQLNINIKDFMKMSDEEVELALYTFKVGDKVITDDGRVGTITNICTCDQCKKRGFYEPRVNTEVGLYDIWITDTDKNNGFISYYKIGDRVFGNVDEKQIDVLKEDIHTRKHEIIALEAQLNVLETLKKEKEND